MPGIVGRTVRTYGGALAELGPRSRRPREIGRLLDDVLPSLPGLSVEQTRRGESLVRRALDGLGFVLLRNVDAEQAVHVLSGKPALRTRHCDDAISAIERKVGVRGAGRHAGRTAYAAVRFSDLTPVLGSTRQRLRLDPGEQRFGPVSFVLDPRTTVARATVSGADTLLLGADMPHWPHTRPRPLEHLPHTVLGWLGDVRSTSGVGLRTLARRIDGDDESAIRWMSSRLTDNWVDNPLLEMQIRGGITLQDVAAIRLDEAALSAQQRAAVTRAARTAGLPAQRLT